MQLFGCWGTWFVSLWYKIVMPSPMALLGILLVHLLCRPPIGSTSWPGPVQRSSVAECLLCRRHKWSRWSGRERKRFGRMVSKTQGHERALWGFLGTKPGPGYGDKALEPWLPAREFLGLCITDCNSSTGALWCSALHGSAHMCFAFCANQEGVVGVLWPCPAFRFAVCRQSRWQLAMGPTT